MELRVDRGGPLVYTDDITSSMLAVSRTPGPLADFVWEAAADWRVPSMDDEKVFVGPFLDVWGYAAGSADQWRIPPSSTASSPGAGPQISISLQVTADFPGYEEHCGHKWYMIDCRMEGLPEQSIAAECDVPKLGLCQVIVHATRGRQLSWRSPRRLAQLRECLHDPVKKVLGNDYQQYFGETPFARHGNVAGTAERLNGWLTTLASVINNGQLQPSAVARVLSFLRGPPEPCGMAIRQVTL